jgi:hypothetical protein
VDPEAALAGFDAAREEWEAAFARVPDAALTYLKPGDDYALGGLLVHVNWVLDRYLHVLEAKPVVAFPPVSTDAGRGLTPEGRRKSLQEMDRLHAAVRTVVTGLDEAEWLRQTPVVYGPGEDPFPTSPEDLVTWLTDHYREHVAQCGDLVGEWSATRRSA